VTPLHGMRRLGMWVCVFAGRRAGRRGANSLGFAALDTAGRAATVCNWRNLNALLIV